jgi:hypothetical protein
VKCALNSQVSADRVPNWDDGSGRTTLERQALPFRTSLGSYSRDRGRERFKMRQ